MNSSLIKSQINLLQMLRIKVICAVGQGKFCLIPLFCLCQMFFGRRSDYSLETDHTAPAAFPILYVRSILVFGRGTLN